jgi:hypothetical protein
MRTVRSLLRKVPEGDGTEGKLGEGTGSIKKYLATTIGRRLDMRSLSMRRSPVVRQVKKESDYLVPASRP